ncbi:ABC transporter permease [Actinoplanes sp. OR16]|uniref:carbohydrate ABC transporter permease n=1 Tax=Actinoplanes sp. OR16 TaxID=946334 RepID=UPI000F71B13F|nr:sugar ABC transporter permease [Actinoplanes sp. OR16]BBH64457.1 ABC transporter permease [Actinoplanes sp. OR16]
MSLTEVRPAPPGEPKHAPPPRGRYWWYRFDTKAVPYLLIAPFFLLFAVFGLFPIIFNAVVSLRTWRIDEPDNRGWAGWENFSRLLTDEDFWNALGNTFGIFVLSTIPQLLIALMVANLLNRKLRATTWWRVGILLPYVTPVAASTLVFAMFFARDYGLANWFLALVGFGEEEPIDWRAAKWSSWIAIATMVNWKWIGYNALLYLSAMQSIPKDVYEAAAVDGAGPWTQLWRITVPMIQPVILFTVVLSTIGGLQLFNEPMLFDQNPASASGGSDGQFQTIAQLIYKVGWKDLNLGYAAAMSWALFLIILIVAGVNALATRRLGGDK